MKYYLAPMEGVTTYIYRSAYHKYFRPMDKYFTPFLVPHTKKGFNARELGEILPEHSRGMYLVPQIMTNNAQDFLHTVLKLQQFGYREVNLNLGCPSRTVVAKHRGSGFLALTEELAFFLDEIFTGTDVDISIKTRLGKDSPGEFYKLLEIFNRYPVKELIIHPRTQKDFYKNHPDKSMFSYGLKESRNPVCYNGDIFTVSDYQECARQFQGLGAVMMGRGAVANPGLISGIEGQGNMELGTLKAFHDEICERYREINFGDKNVLFKMKELWAYMIHLFPDSEKDAKRIRKSENLKTYQSAVEELFQRQEDTV